MKLHFALLASMATAAQAVAEDPVLGTCVQVPLLDDSSTEKGTTVGMYESMPIHIGQQSGDTVKFRLDQTWKNGQPIDWVGLVFNDGENEMVCHQSTDFVDSTQEYTGSCFDGVLSVGVFVRDSSFQGLTDITSRIPDQCDAPSEDAFKSQQAYFVFSVPCNKDDQAFCDKDILCDEENPDDDNKNSIDTSGDTHATDKDREGGGGYGDPHLKVWTGETYDFHGECDLVLVKSAKFGNGKGLQIQIRTEIRHDWSFIATAAIKIGEEVLEVGGHAAYAMNGIVGEELKKNTDLQDLAGYPVKYFNYGTRRHKFQIDLGDKQKLLVKIYNEFLAVGIEEAEEADFGDAVGMMGHFHTGEHIGRDGHIIQDNKEFGFDWQVREADAMLFREAQGPQYPTSCRMPSPKAIKRRKRRLGESMISYQQAEEACASWDEESREACIYDVLATGDLKMAQAGAF